MKRIHVYLDDSEVDDSLRLMHEGEPFTGELVNTYGETVTFLETYRNGWADGKLPSCAHWLNFKCGLNLGAAREKVRVAHALVGLPKIAASMSRGELSYSKVRALTRVACEATEDNLLMIALHGTAHHVERLVRCYRRAQEAEELSREAQQHEIGRAHV